MDKQKQIEEMAKDMHEGHIEICNNTLFDDCPKNCHICNAKAFYERGYRKIPENAVVLTREEYDGKGIVVEMSGGHKLKLSVGKFGEMSKILEEHTRKETAEKFAERAKEEAFVVFMGEPIIRASKLDEICKEITR